MWISHNEFGILDILEDYSKSLEEIVGNILDEYDIDEQFITRSENTWMMNGMTPLEDVQDELKVEFPEEDLDNYDTINGLLISKLDRIPKEGEQPEVRYLGYLFAVTKVANKMIHTVHVTPIPKEELEQEEDGGEKEKKD